MTVELKNGLIVEGVLVSVDQFLNLQLVDIKHEGASSTPIYGSAHLAALDSAFIRGSVVRYISLPSSKVNVQVLHDSTRVENRAAK